MHRRLLFVSSGFVPRRSSSYYAKKSQVFEWMKLHDSALQAEIKRSSFVVFIDQHPLLRRSASSANYTVPLIHHSRLVQLSGTLGFTFDSESAALVDVTPMQGGTNDLEEEFLPVFALNLRSSKFSTSDHKAIESEFKGELFDSRAAMFIVTEPSSLRLLAKSQVMLRWSHSTRFCSKCAAPVKMRLSKASATCTSCAKEFHPSISPVAITLLTNDKNDHALLVRQPRHPPGMYTAVAGFAEVGEPIEETVRREVAEEVGLDVDCIRYAGVSQPWPFPQMSLMCGFRGTIHGLPEPHIDTAELEAAHWFSRSQVELAFKNSSKLSNPESIKGEACDTISNIPPAGAIAHDLIKQWLTETK